MPNAVLAVRDGEANLDAKLFEDNSLNVVMQEAIRRGFEIAELRIDRVRKNGAWKSTEGSTVPAAVLYFESGNGQDYLITKRPEDEKYGLFRYHWTL